MGSFVILFILTIYLAISHANQDPYVEIPLGGIKGHYKVSENGLKFEAFEGIPYASPPVGELRFKPPEKVAPWIGNLSATNLAPACLQYVYVSPEEMVKGSEDCLYLNVYRPNKNKSQKLPVLIWIHGGYFMFGSAELYRQESIIDRNVILVTISYRLGPLGFLSTEDQVVPGNMGLKDQNMAIRWVSENIEFFGGIKENVTLVGLSAGGASVHFHYLSPLSAGLFAGGISISGNALLPWVQTGGAGEKAKKLGALLGCPTNENGEMIRCLRKRPAQSIVQAVENFIIVYYTPTTPFGPVVEKIREGFFINRKPKEIIESGDVQDLPWITGIVSEEGIYPTGEFIANNERLKYLDENWNTFAPQLLDFNYTVPIKEHATVAQTIKEHYFGTKSIDKSTVKELIQMTGDRTFVIDAEKSARMQAKVNKSPVWFYYFSYRGAHSISEIVSKSQENFGVSHGDDALYVFNFLGINTTSTENDRKMQKDLLDLWISFADKREPNLQVNWTPVDPINKKLKYLHISGPKEFRMEENENLGEKNFWNTIFF